MQKATEINELLQKVINAGAGERAQYVSAVQDKIWDVPAIPNEALQQVLSDLAYDLNFYEDNEEDRDENLGYYGDERLEQIVRNAIQKTETYLQSVKKDAQGYTSTRE